MRGLAKWLVVVPVTLVMLVIARDPDRRLPQVFRGTGTVVLQPVERIAGSDEPPAPRVAPELEGLDSKSLRDAAAYAEQQDSTALIVSRHEHIVFEKYWHGTDFNTVEDGQSLSRIVVALAVGAALSQRQIHWPGEPIGYFISSLGNDPRASITVDQLLRMSSGLHATDTGAVPGMDLIEANLAEPLASKPGTTWEEKSADPQLAAFVIERATRMRYAEFVSENLWKRIGAGDAWVWLDREGGKVHAECCMRARQGDWMRVAQLLIHDGNYRGDEVIHPGWVPHMLIPAQANPGYGAYVSLAKAQTTGAQRRESREAPAATEAQRRESREALVARRGTRRGATGTESFATDDLFVVAGNGGNRLWLVPSMQLAILRMAPAQAERPADWDDTRIPNLIIRSARDYKPPQARPAADISTIVPGH